MNKCIECSGLLETDCVTRSAIGLARLGSLLGTKVMLGAEMGSNAYRVALRGGLNDQCRLQNISHEVQSRYSEILPVGRWHV